MSYLLDTNAVIALMKQHPQMLQFVRRVGYSQLFLCAPVEAELWFGVYKSARTEDALARSDEQNRSRGVCTPAFRQLRKRL